MTICPAPGQGVNLDGAPNDLADAHVRDKDCVE